jgi:hypothetical protein
MSNKNVYRDMGKSVFSDECYTTRAESDKIVSYLIENNLLSKNMIVWCPFDNELSNIYKSLKTLWGGDITLTNLEMGLDFYNYEPEKWDIIISNPPFKGRTNLMNRLIKLDKPFIILQATQFFNNQFAVNYLCEFSDDFQFILPRSRMNFITYNPERDILCSSKNGAAFYSFWLCYKVGLEQTFNNISDSGKEREVEEYDKQGNVIIDNHMDLFNYAKKGNKYE